MIANRFGSNLWHGAPFASALALLVAFGGSSAHAQTAATSVSEPPAEAVPAETVPATAAPAVTRAETSTPGPPATVANATDAAKAPETESSTSASDADAEAAALEAQLNTQSDSSGPDEFHLNFYGFADFTFAQVIGNFSLYSAKNTFALGKLNLYSSAELGDDWRSLTEIRFTYLPHGSSDFNDPSGRRVDTTVGDYTDLNRPVKLGGIIIERAWLEHTFHPALTVRAGQWLTPYGIWNVDHGSPVIISVRKPYIVGDSLFPERQTGLEIYGAWGFGAGQLGYHVTISNGRGPIDSYQDLDNNKGLGGRLFWKQEGSFGVLTLGASGYRGKYTDSVSQFSFDATGAPTTEHPVTVRYDELSLAADLKWEWGGLLLQSEAILNDVAYDGAYRPSDMAPGSGPPAFTADHRRVGIYGMAGYRTSFLGLMPFFGSEYYDESSTMFARSVSYFGGLNCRPTPRVVLKAQFTHTHFPDSSWMEAYKNVDLQAAWSF